LAGGNRVKHGPEIVSMQNLAGEVSCASLHKVLREYGSGSQKIHSEEVGYASVCCRS
jgi:hypothetical protein